ncbi:hypothetical protein ACP275_01G096800 [Erythranthe tilingii]
MASSTTLFLVFNILFFAMVTPTPPKTPTTPTTPKTPTAPSTPKAPSPSKATCPRDTLKLGACANLLNDLVSIVVGTPLSKKPCCTLIGGLTDLEAAVCLCTAVKANVLGINLNVPISLSLILNACDKKVPSGFKCA